MYSGEISNYKILLFFSKLSPKCLFPPSLFGKNIEIHPWVGLLSRYDCSSYFPQSDVGTYFSLSAIVGGATGVVLGGAAADRLAGHLCQGLVMERSDLN